MDNSVDCPTCLKRLISQNYNGERKAGVVVEGSSFFAFLFLDCCIWFRRRSLRRWVFDMHLLVFFQEVHEILGRALKHSQLCLPSASQTKLPSALVPFFFKKTASLSAAWGSLSGQFIGLPYLAKKVDKSELQWRAESRSVC